MITGLKASTLFEAYREARSTLNTYKSLGYKYQDRPEYENKRRRQWFYFHAKLDEKLTAQEKELEELRQKNSNLRGNIELILKEFRDSVLENRAITEKFYTDRGE